MFLTPRGTSRATPMLFNGIPSVRKAAGSLGAFAVRKAFAGAMALDAAESLAAFSVRLALLHADAGDASALFTLVAGGVTFPADTLRALLAIKRVASVT